MKRALSILPGVAAVAAAGAIYLGAFGSSSLPEKPTSAQVNAYVMSPFCPGLTLEECPSNQAGRLRAQIAQRLASGSSGPEIERWLVSTYGEGVLGRPRRVGVFVLPGMLLAFGVMLVIWKLRFWRSAPSSPPEPEIEPSWESDRVKRELEAFAGGTE